MIEFISLRDLGVIKSADLELSAGLTVLTGETGAGKTMVLTALNLLLGGKADPGLSASEHTCVQGAWRLNPNHPVLAGVAESGGVVDDDGELLLTRLVPAGGRGRCLAGGVAVPMSTLSQWGDQLVAVHGQSDQSLLKREPAQRAVLDRFAGPQLADALSRYGATYVEVRNLDRIVTQTVSSTQQRADELARLHEGLELIERMAPFEGEDDELADRALRLTNLDQLSSAASGALAAVIGDDDAGGGIVELTGRAKRALESGAELDPELETLSVRVAEIGMLANEVGMDLSRYLADLDVSPSELANVEQRRAEINALLRVYGPSIKDTLDWSQRAAQRVFELEGATNLAGLQAERVRKRLELAVLAAELTAIRARTAQAFAAAVSEEIRGLSMPDASLLVEVSHRTHRGETEALVLPGGDSVGFGPEGTDEVQFLLVAHRGASAAPLARAASGGELSRVMLALEVVLADSTVAPTFVFDEVDAGVGGKAAVEVGRRLARLAKSAQVLVVTHLPQVAAFADHHLVVSKTSDGLVTQSNVRSLDETERVRELARMLAGQDDSEHAAAHAVELLDLAAVERDANGAGFAQAGA